MFALRKTPVKQWKNKPETWRKYFQMIYLIIDMYLRKLNNSYNSIIWQITQYKKLKMEKFKIIMNISQLLITYPVRNAKENPSG